MYRNAKNVGYYMIGKGALSQLGDILTPLRARHENGPAIFFLDHCFKDGHAGQTVCPWRAPIR